MDSWLPMLASDLGAEQRLWRGGYIWQRCTSAGVVEGRNEVARKFLDEKQSEWLFFIDADMGWDIDALDRLIAAADPEERPIVGGLCFGFGPINDRMDHANAVVKKPFPTVMYLQKTDDDYAFRASWNYVSNRLTPVDATGAALLLIHRTVLEQMRDKFGDTWFDRIRHPDAKNLWGEDTSFCYRAKAGLGFPVFVHTGVRSSHAKTIYVTESTYMSDLVAQPTDVTVDVIVPVLERPQNAEPFMRSLRATTGLATVYAVCNVDEDAEAWAQAGAEVIRTEAISFPEKVNVAYPQTSAPWVFLCGDDVAFRPGWWDHVQRVASTTGANVVGTNDLANPLVLSGDHATHMAISRSYIDETGASWDGPGVVCHEGYRHQFVDDEILTAAKQRNTWAPCLASFVEHHHPLWGNAEDDETYRRGARHEGKDKALFIKRLEESTGKVAA